MLLRVALVAVVAVALVAPAAVTWTTEWLWFQEVGYGGIFLKTLATKAILGALALALTTAFVGVNLHVALAPLGNRRIVLGSGSGEVEPIVLDRASLWKLCLLASAVAGAVAAALAVSRWFACLWFWDAAPFQAVDPIFGRDLSFYVFRLPLLEVVRAGGFLLVAATAAGAGAIYAVTGNIGRDPRARTHLSLLAALLFLVFAFGAHVDALRLILTPAPVFHGAAYADVEARLPARRLLMVVSVVGAVLAIVQARSRRTWPIATAVGLTVACSLGGNVYTSLLHRFVVAPNELAKETPYILHNIAATRQGFGLHGVEEREISGDAPLTRADIDRNVDTIENVRLWDHQPLLDTFGQMQEIRTYYDFVSVDNDRYVIDGAYRQVMLSARELDSESLPNRNWINERLTFTHGYGLTLGPVNQTTQEGLPVLYIKNLPPESSVDLRADEPSIYFGERSSDYVIVKGKAPEFHYPRGDDNVTTRYDGRGGVAVGGLLRKILFAVRFRTVKILFSDDVTAESRILYHRRIVERVRTIAPFLKLDDDPYLVLSGGRLYWMLDAYTTSDHFPYANATEGINYIRNSVKVVVDAYHGTTTFYQADAADPLAQALGDIFPGLLRPLADMPDDLRRHVRYPQKLFELQAAMYSTYHMENPAVFYNKEDQWEIPTVTTAQGAPVRVEPYFTVMKLPGEEHAEFIQMLPVTPRRKDNLAAWMAARSDGEHYGKLMVFQFPKQKVVFGPKQIVARINQDQTISPQITLWNQQGSQVQMGTLLVTPIEESLLYIQPLYLRSAGGKIPELKRVIVAYGNQIVMEPTLPAALERLFGPPGKGDAAPPPVAVPEPRPAPEPRPSSPEDPRAAAALAHYREALEAQRRGDWAAYGEGIRKVGELLEQMASEPATAP